MDEIALPSEPTCIVRANETAQIMRGGVRLPSGKIVDNLSGCKLESGAILTLYYGDPISRIKKKSPEVIESTPNAPTAESLTTPTAETLTLESTPTIIEPTLIVEPHTQQFISVSAALIFSCICAMLAATASKATKRASFAIITINSRSKERESEHCATKSDLVSNKINMAIESVESSPANEPKISEPEWLYRRISKVKAEISIINKKLKNRSKNDKKS